jgi:hypothetical protein
MDVRKDLANYQLQLGTSVFIVPPTMISVDRMTTTHRVDTIRSRNSIKKQSGHTDTKVAITLIFPTPEAINDPVNGLRALLAQFMRTPFVPVYNYYLNVVQGIDALCLYDITARTITSFPGSLQVDITCFDFDYNIFMPGAQDFGSAINEKLMTWYYQRGLLVGSRKDATPRLKSVTGFLSELSFTTANIDAYNEYNQLAVNYSSVQDKNAKRIRELNEVCLRAKNDLDVFEKAMKKVPAVKASGIPSSDTIGYSIYLQNKRIYIAFSFKQYRVHKALPKYLKERSISDYKDPVIREANTWIATNEAGNWTDEKAELEKILKKNIDASEAELKKEQDIQRDQKSKLVKAEERVHSQMKNWAVPDWDKVVVSDIAISFQNAFSRFPTQMSEKPAYQFLGGQDIYAKISLKVASEAAVLSLRSLFEQNQKYARKYHYNLTTSFLGIKNEIFQLFGVDYVFIDSMSCVSVLDYPGLYSVEITFMDFDVFQRTREYGEVIVKEGDQYRLSGSGPNVYDFGAELCARDPMSGAKDWVKIENLFKYINVYPDLDLPTYDEVKNSLGISLPNSDKGYFVDPDFYFYPDKSMSSHIQETYDELWNGNYAAKMYYYSDVDGELVPTTINKGADWLSKMRGDSRVLKNYEKLKKDVMGALKVDAKKAHETVQAFQELDSGFQYMYEQYLDSPQRANLAAMNLTDKKAQEEFFADTKINQASLSLPEELIVPIEEALAEMAVIAYLHANNGEVGSDAVSVIMNGSALNDGRYLHFDEKGVRDQWADLGEVFQKNKTGKDADSKMFMKIFKAILKMDPQKKDLRATSMKVIDLILSRSSDNWKVDKDQLIAKYLDAYVSKHPSLRGQLLSNIKSGRWQSSNDHDRMGRMVRAFPTAHLFLVDEGMRVRWYRIWDNFYGLNALTSLEVITSRKNVADTAVISVSNTYMHFNDRTVTVKNKPFDINTLFLGVIDDEMKRAQNTVMPQIGLFPGARVHIRMGYGNNLSNLPTVFNGTITECNVAEVMTVIAQGDGMEFCNVLKFDEHEVSSTALIHGTTFGAEPSNYLSKLLLHGDASGLFMAWNLLREVWGPNDKNPVKHFGNPKFLAGFIPNAGELAMNIYPGNGTAKKERWAIYNDEPNVEVSVYGKTIWDIGQIMAAAVPNYIFAIRPFGMRSTAFYGKPWWDYIYDYEISPKHLDKAWKQDDFYVQPKAKPFMQWHVYSSYGSIINNKIKATSENVYTNVIASFKKDSVFSLNHDAVDETVMMRADKDIYPNIQKTTMIDSCLYNRKPFPLLWAITGAMALYKRVVGTKTLAQNVAASAIRDYLKDMYQGELVVFGDPTVWPYDAMYVGDSYNEMTGTCLVKQVVHQFSKETGFITSLVPDCAVGNIDDEFILEIQAGSCVAAGACAKWFFKTSVSLFSKYVLRKAISSPLSSLGSWISSKSSSLTEKWAGNKIGKAVVEKLLQAGTNISRGGLAVEEAAAAGEALAGVTLSIPAAALLFVATTMIAKMVTATFEQWMRESQCVVINLLRYRGKEFSAGINGHSGIAVSGFEPEYDQTTKKYRGFWGRVANVLPEGIRNFLNIHEQSFNPEMFLGPSSSYPGEAQEEMANIEAEGDFSMPEYDGKRLKVKFQWNNSLRTRGTVIFNHNQVEFNYSKYCVNVSVADKVILAMMIQAEAGNQGTEGKLAVGAVIVNRMQNGWGDGTLQGVIFAKGQFQPVMKGQEGWNNVVNTGVRSDCLNIAEMVLCGKSNVGQATYFMNPNGSTYNGIKDFALNRRFTKKIEDHYFFANRLSTDSYMFVVKKKVENLENYSKESVPGIKKILMEAIAHDEAIRKRGG